MKAKDLKPGDQYKIGNMRKFRDAAKIIQLDTTDNIPDMHKGHLLVIDFCCRQQIIHPETDVIIKESLETIQSPLPPFAKGDEQPNFKL